MKREAVVCDLQTGWNKTCPRLADFVCPLCQRDVCGEHQAAQVLVCIQGLWPNRAQAAGLMPKDDPAAIHKAATGICVDCFKGLESIGDARSPSVDTLVKTTLTAAIEAFGADLATAKLSKNKP